jgi:hypothetical protein
MEKGLLQVFFAAAIFLVWVSLLTPPSAVALPSEQQLGSVNFPTGCSSSVQRTMETGLALLHSFQYEESEHAFAGAANDDPKCALAYWGKAMALYQPLWDFPNARAIALGRQYVEQAQKLEAGDARISGYISAAAAFFQSAKLTPAARTRAYSLAMEKLYREQPEDNEVGELYALSLVALAQMGIDDLANRKKAIAILNPIFATYPESPGAAHYLIHAADTRELAPEALAAAQAYAKIAPDSAHALHMPSHIFRRLGLWQAMIDSNLASASAAAKASKEHHGGADYQLHARDFLDYAYLQSGQEAKARQLVGELKGVAGAAPADVIDAQNRFAARNALELHHWKEAAALAIPKEKLEFQDYTYWARAIGAARSGDVQGARADVQKLVEIAQLVKSKQMAAQGNGGMSDAGMAIDPSEAAGWLAYAEHNPDEALRILRRAAAREMLADLLLELGKPGEAMAEYKNVLKNFPNRFNALVGAARAADLSADSRAAKQFYSELLTNCPPKADRPELQDAKKYLAAHSN